MGSREQEIISFFQIVIGNKYNIMCSDMNYIIFVKKY